MTEESGIFCVDCMMIYDAKAGVLTVINVNFNFKFFCLAPLFAPSKSLGDDHQ